MRAALELRQTPFRVVVAVGFSAAGVVERNPLIITQGRSTGALVVVLVHALGPNSGEVGQLQDWSALRENAGPSRKRREQNGKETHATPNLQQRGAGLQLAFLTCLRDTER